MADEKCTCRTTRRERFLDRSCAVHGDAEMHRRHEAASRGAESPTRQQVANWYEGLDDYGKRFAWETVHAFTELDDDEKEALKADLDAAEESAMDEVDVIQMHRTMARMKREDPTAYARAVADTGWNGSCRLAGGER